MLENRTCLVCGFYPTIAPLKTESGYWDHIICDSCGFHFGFHEHMRSSEELSFYLYRKHWINEKGMKWHFKGSEPPADWDPGVLLQSAMQEQIKRLLGTDV